MSTDFDKVDNELRKNLDFYETVLDVPIWENIPLSLETMKRDGIITDYEVDDVNNTGTVKLKVFLPGTITKVKIEGTITE